MGTTTMVTAVAVLAGLAGTGAVWATPRAWGGRGAVPAGLAAACGVGVIALLLLRPVGSLSLFGLAHLGYLGFVISVPLIGLALGLRALLPTDRSLNRWWTALGVAMLLPAAVGWYATHIAPFRLEVDHRVLQLEPERAGTDTVRVGVLADLQTNEVTGYEHRAVDRLLAEEPDIILLPGDLFQGHGREFRREEQHIRELVERLHAPYGVYFVEGDVDGTGYPERAFAGTDVVIVDDELVEIEAGDRQIRLVGNSMAYQSPAAREARELLTDHPDDNGDAIHILMAHRPGAALDLPPDSRVDLVVAGHTHGGQIAVPGFGPLMTLSDVPRDVAAGGLHELDGNPIYVSTGVGMERGQAPQVRLFTRPSVGVLDLG